MDNVLNNVGRFLNNIGVRKIHELLTDQEHDTGEQSLVNIYTGGTAIVTLLTVFLIRKVRR
jgi:hypothetical protein